jgi:hypothetical protein
MTSTSQIVKRDENDGRAERQVAVTLFGTTNPETILRRTEELAGSLAMALRDRDLARRYGDGDRHFIMIEGWQLVGTFLGVSARTTWTRRLEDSSGWEARAEAVTADGRVLGAADAMCQRTEPGRRSQTEHAIRAMAQVRARRGALRSVLAFVPAIGGLDLSDPDAPATRRQVVALHTLAGERGWDHDEAHSRAGVGSFNELTREQAAALIDAWSPAETGRAEETTDKGGHVHRWQPVDGRALERCDCGQGRRVPA